MSANAFSRYRVTYLHNGVQHVAITLAESEAEASTKIARHTLSVRGSGFIDILSCGITFRDSKMLLAGEVHIYY